MGGVKRRGMRRLLGVLGAAAALLAACQGRAPKPAAEAAPPKDTAGAAPGPETALTPALAIARHAEELMSIPGVVGVYEGETADQPVLRVMVVARTDSILRRVPKTLEGYPVEIEVSGPIKPMSK